MSRPDGTSRIAGVNVANAHDIDEATRLLIKSGNYYISTYEVNSQGRQHMNFLPIMLNLFLPWIGFVTMLTLSIFRWRHEHLVLNNTLWFILIIVLAGIYVRRIWKEMTWTEARWTRASFCSVVFNICACLISSFFLYRLFFSPYYQLKDLKTYPLIDVSKSQGRDIMDAGAVYFAKGTTIDLSRSWHFKHDTNYCVAPLVKRDMSGNLITTETGSTDFFVTGKNCCSTSASDFQCDGYDNPKFRAGLRIINTEDLPFFRLAVNQGETKFGFISTYPIFLEWVEDPVFQLEELRDVGMNVYYTLLGSSFFWQLAIIGFFVWRFSYLGRWK